MKQIVVDANLHLTLGQLREPAELCDASGKVLGRYLPAPEQPPRPCVNPPDDSWLPRAFFENQAKVPWQVLEPYRGQHIAWSWDGSKILAADPDQEQLWNKLESLGHNPRRVVFDYVDEI
jgi:hypothetical protein